MREQIKAPPFPSTPEGLDRLCCFAVRQYLEITIIRYGEVQRPFKLILPRDLYNRGMTEVTLLRPHVPLLQAFTDRTPDKITPLIEGADQPNIVTVRPVRWIEQSLILDILLEMIE